jgi:hypothetical protein
MTSIPLLAAFVSNTWTAWASAVAVVAIVVLPLFFARHQGRPLARVLGPVLRREFLTPLTWRGVAWAAAFPLLWLGLLYAFVLHLRLALGRWPHFGEELHGFALRTHYRLVEVGTVAGVLSLPVAALAAGLCLSWSRSRPVSSYLVLYAAALGLAGLGLAATPQAFLNWLLD